MRVFLSQSSRRIGEMIVFLSALRNIRDVLGSAQVFQFMYVEKNLFYYKEILHFATLRSEWQSSVLESRIKNSRHRVTDVEWDTRHEYFYHKVHGELVKWLCFWAHWGTSEIVKSWCCDVVMLKYFLLRRDSSLCCASFRMTSSCT